MGQATTAHEASGFGVILLTPPSQTRPVAVSLVNICTYLLASNSSPLGKNLGDAALAMGLSRRLALEETIGLRIIFAEFSTDLFTKSAEHLAPIKATFAYPGKLLDNVEKHFNAGKTVENLAIIGKSSQEHFGH